MAREKSSPFPAALEKRASALVAHSTFLNGASRNFYFSLSRSLATHTRLICKENWFQIGFDARQRKLCRTFVFFTAKNLLSGWWGRGVLFNLEFRCPAGNVQTFLAHKEEMISNLSFDAVLM